MESKAQPIGLLKFYGLQDFSSKLQLMNISEIQLRQIPLGDARIHGFANQVGMNAKQTKKFRDMHEKMHLNTQSFHMRPCTPVSNEGPFRVVLVGKVGSGKTAVYNAMTGLSEDVGAGSASVTRRANEAFSVCGNLRVVDTPGLGAREDKALHAHALRAALSEPAHAVVFVAEMGARTEDAIQNIKAHYGVLQPFHNNLIVLFTKCDKNVDEMDLETELDAKGQMDKSSEGFKTKSRYIEEINKTHPAAGYIFYHHGVSDGWLRNQLRRACTKLEPMSHSFSDFEFAWHFDTAKEFTKEEEAQIKKIEDDFRILCENTWSKVEAVKWEDPLYVGAGKRVFLSDLTVWLAATAENMVSSYSDIVKCEVTPDIFAHYLQVKKKIATPLKIITQKLQMINNDELVVARGNYRKCPHCAIVWYKTPAAEGYRMGCDGSTTCGNRMKALDIPENGGLRFQFTLDNDRHNVKWNRSQFSSATSFEYMSRGISNEVQVTVDIEFASATLKKISGSYIRQSDNIYTKTYSYYLNRDERPVLSFSGGFWQIKMAANQEWCIQQRGEATQPPGGQWQIHPRFLQREQNPTLHQGQEWIVLVDGKEQVLRLDSVRSRFAGMGTIIHGMNLTTGEAYDDTVRPDFYRRNTKALVKVVAAVGCGKRIVWSQMEPVEEETLKGLGLTADVETLGTAMEVPDMGLQKDLLVKADNGDGVSTRASSPREWEDIGDEGDCVSL